MRDRYQPGLHLVLPSGRRVRIVKVIGGWFKCHYVGSGTRGLGGEVDLTRLFADRHCLLVEGAAA